MGAPSDEHVSLQMGCKKAAHWGRVGPSSCVGQRRGVGAIPVKVASDTRQAWILRPLVICWGVLTCPVVFCRGLICVLPFAAAYRNLGQNLWGPHRYGCLSGVRVRTVVSGSCAAHSLLITTEGKLWSWGKYWMWATHTHTHTQVGLRVTWKRFCLLSGSMAASPHPPVCVSVSACLRMWRPEDNLGVSSCLPHFSVSSGN